MIFKNLTVLALNGRKIFETWYKVRWLLESGVVDLRPLISHDLPFEKVNEAITESGFEITDIVSGAARGVDKLGEQ